MPDLRIALLALGALLVPAAASAEPTPIRELLKLSCTGDYLEHCSMHPPGGPEVEACFKANIRKLSPPCAQAINAYRRQKKSGQHTSSAR
ncbi:hypothetical protein [Methylobacterium sp. J-068]|uniref:hypothetical protein n=1 Tax=Methylobacterium sp. J-068 TaxID=2836649 RepID=UPI001FB96658|nr:hypothetical protein [Methylobacterium sp. J-068]MCJ2036271.1 hypothetical protein [Methylobacterium sp. J-068]